MLKLQLPAILTRPMRIPSEPTSGVDSTGTPEKNEARTVSAFLDDVVNRLPPLPAATRADIRAELRAHLEASIAARGELGENRDAATVAAIQRFGEPRTIARRFCRVWDTTTLETPSPAMREALRLVSLATFIYLAGHALNSFVILPFVRSYLGYELSNFLFFFWYSGALVVLPLLVGARVGWMFPRRGGLGTFCALVLCAIATSPLYALGLKYYAAYSTSLERSPVLLYCVILLFLLTVGFLICLPLGTIAAIVSGNMKRNKYRRTSDGSRIA